MNRLKYISLTALVAAGLAVAAPRLLAQVSINIGPRPGPPPNCPYGYYDFAPYACAPYGYYGPEWFLNGLFIGAGPWFHGPARFHGYVNNRFSPQHGYRGPLPPRGARAVNRPGGVRNFHGNEVRDGRGHSGGPR